MSFEEEKKVSKKVFSQDIAYFGHVIQRDTKKIASVVELAYVCAYLKYHTFCVIAEGSKTYASSTN